MGSNSSFYNQNATVGSVTNPPGPVDAPLTNTPKQAPSSFYGTSGPILASMMQANFSISVTIPGLTLSPNEWLFGYVFDFAGTFPTNFTGSQAKAGAAATNPAVLSIRKNGVQFGTVTFTGTAGSFSGTQTNFAVGDLLEVIAPATADPTLAHLSINLLGTRI